MSFCWTHARKWHKFQQKDGVPDKENVLVFVSIGMQEKLEMF